MVDLQGLFSLRCRHLLKDRVVKPKVDVALPEALFRDWRHVENGSFKNLPRSGNINRGLLLQRAVVEPQVIVQGLLLNGPFELVAPSCQNHILNFVPRSKLLLKGDELVCERTAVLFRNIFEGIFE